MSDLYGFTYTLDKTLKTMEDVISAGNHDGVFLGTYYWLKTLKEYREIGTVEECREAVEKQKPKKPQDIEYDWSYFVCDNCGESIYCSDDFESHHYCLNCGHAIQWDEIRRNGMKNETEIKRLKRRLNEAEYTRDFCISQLIMAVEEIDKYKEELKTCGAKNE